jgi:uncharacterized protein YjbJ (UPF0337 family)
MMAASGGSDHAGRCPKPDRRVIMARKRTTTRWQQMQSQVKAKWNLLTDADIAGVQGNVERLIDVLQARYGYGRRTAMREINLWSQSLRGAAS